MFRQYSVEDQNLSRIGVLFCSILCGGVFFLALMALPFKRNLPGPLELLGNTVNFNHKQTAEPLTSTPGVPAADAPAVTTISPALPLVAPTPVNVAIQASAASRAAPPTMSASSSPTPGQGLKTYTVQAGDTLYSLARRSGASAESLAALNSLSSTATLKVGQRLELP